MVFSKSYISFTIDDSKMIRYATDFIEVLKVGQKTKFGGHFVILFVYSLLHPMEYTPRSYKMNKRIKIYIYDKFH